ncbi:MAG: peptidoglycan-associated lipoprotein Pal [Bacteriovoracales bacterium]|nr:peptidoglycan-associated lipoprotein Pal [Bacteriovoracales bacterium]
MTIFSIRMVSTVLLGLALALGGCSSSDKKTSGVGDDYGDKMPGDMPLELNGDSDSNTAGGIKTIYFDFNSSQLSSETRSILESNASFLKDNSGVEVEIEGHCDERGSVEYNLALGDRRAMAVKNYLSSLGVEVSRLSHTSYGKEKPVEYGHDEMAWQKNRRANFRVLSK